MWDNIVHNLNGRRLTAIDAKVFSVHLFAAADSSKWCKDYNAKLIRGQVHDQQPDEERAYQLNEVDIIVDMIKRTGILDRPGFTVRQAFSFGRSIQAKIVDYNES